MRANEFLLEYQEPKVQQAQRDGVDLTAHRYGNKLTIDADAHGRNLARVVFDVAGQRLVAQDLLVNEAYRGQGIAAVMYDYAKELGYRVERSGEQTDAGKAFWDKNRGEEATVWENFADGKVKGKSRPGRVKRAGASCNGSVTDLRARAKRASGEKAKMYHWCANMKSGKKK
jgi:GNAT superfamily N-acetyltransferase